MPRQITTDAHEWINEIPTVPIYYLESNKPTLRSFGRGAAQLTTHWPSDQFMDQMDQFIKQAGSARP